MLIDFVPTVAGVSLAEARGFEKSPGGALANVAVGVARLGGSAAFIGKVHFLQKQVYLILDNSSYVLPVSQSLRACESWLLVLEDTCRC